MSAPINEVSVSTPCNIINLADRIQAKVENSRPLLEASGVMLSIWESKLLSCDLKNTHLTLGRVLDELTQKAASDRSVTQLRTAALLYRIQGEVKLAIKRAEKLERKLAKAKRWIKRRE
jgi:hypothetical protein